MRRICNGEDSKKTSQLESLGISLKETGTLGRRPELICWVFKFCLDWFALAYIRQGTDVGLRLLSGLITLIYCLDTK